MHVVLQKDIKGLGHKGDIASVKDGYFRNFLLPRGLALMATERLIQKTAEVRKNRMIKMEEIKKRAQELQQTLAGCTLVIASKATAKGKLYGSVDEAAIVEALKNQAHVELETSQVKMTEHLKKTGEYSVELRLTDTVRVPLKVNVEATQEAKE